MPLLVNMFIFTKVPDRVSFIIRPIFRFVFNALIQRLITPQLLRTTAYVLWFSGFVYLISSSCFRSKITLPLAGNGSQEAKSRRLRTT